jgi:hypothetical protein
MQRSLALFGSLVAIGCAGEESAVVRSSLALERAAAFSLEVDGEQATTVFCHFEATRPGAFGLYAATDSPEQSAAAKAIPAEEWIGRSFPGLGELIDVHPGGEGFTLQDSYRAGNGLRYYTLVAPESERPLDVEIEVQTNVADFGEIDVLRDSARATLEWIFGADE